MSAFCTKTHGTAELIKGEGGRGERSKQRKGRRR